ncbi:MAG: hypothetical protein ACP5C3_09970 [Methanomicrobiales archaeon]
MKRNKLSKAQYIDERIIKRLRIYLMITFIILVLIIWEVYQGKFNIILVLGGILGGFFIGLIVSRMYNLTWDEETNIVVSNIDWIGAVILVFYFIFVFSRTYLLGHWIDGTPLFCTVLSLTAGTMLGRVLGTDRRIYNILKALKID